MFRLTVHRQSLILIKLMSWVFAILIASTLTIGTTAATFAATPPPASIIDQCLDNGAYLSETGDNSATFDA